MTRPTDAAIALDKAWRELEADALASDGAIRDRDVRDAIKRNRARIEAAAIATLARVIAIGQAWVAAEEAVLGRGAGIEMTVRTLPGAWSVASWYDRVDGEGDRLASEPSPEAALLALAAALTDQERGS